MLKNEGEKIIKSCDAGAKSDARADQKRINVFHLALSRLYFSCTFVLREHWGFRLKCIADAYTYTGVNKIPIIKKPEKTTVDVYNYWFARGFKISIEHHFTIGAAALVFYYHRGECEVLITCVRIVN